MDKNEKIVSPSNINSAYSSSKRSNDLKKLVTGHHQVQGNRNMLDNDGTEDATDCFKLDDQEVDNQI